MVMSAKDMFTDAEWKRVVSAPMLTAMAVTAADPGGLFSAFQESAAVAKAIATGPQEGDGLIPELTRTYKSFGDSAGVMETIRAALGEARAPADVVAASVAELARIASLVTAKAPAFTAWLIGVAQSVAEAGKEGGFLGFGGTAVSAAETATLERLQGALTGAS
jgi:hypothetical protein